MMSKLKKGMKLLKPASGKNNYLYLQGFFPIYPIHSGAFRDAADELVKARLSAKKGPHKDSLAYPILYLYRHSLELYLKDLLRIGIRTGDVAFEDVEVMLGEHELCPLWNKVKALLQSSYPDDKQASIVESIVMTFHELDKDGQKLRFEHDKSGRKQNAFAAKAKPTSKNGMHSIDLANLLEVAGELFNYLEFAFLGISGHHDAMLETMPNESDY